MIKSNLQTGLFVTTSIMIQKFLICVFFLHTTLIPTPVQATPQIQAANDLIQNMIADVENYLSETSGDTEKRKKDITKLLDTYFDLPSVARFSAGPYWRAASETQQASYTAIMRQVVINTVVRNFDRLIGLRFTLTNSQMKGKKMVLVRGTFRDAAAKNSPISVGWRVVTPPSSPAKVLDVEIENISMLVTQKQENIAIIRQNAGSFEALIDAMKKNQKE